MKSRQGSLTETVKTIIFHGIFHAVLLFGIFKGYCANAQVSAQQEKQINSLFRLWDTDSTPGMEIMILHKGKIEMDKAYGLSDISRKKPNSSNRKMWVASVSKQFTGLAIALLISQKKIGMEDDIRKYLPVLPFLGDTIKIKHLVYHTSGLREGFTLTAMSFKPEEEYSNENVLHYLSRQTGRNFAPGARFEYNNSGYVLLAIIVEKVSRLSFPDFVQQNILDPLGMKDSRFYASFPVNDTSIAKGYAVTVENNRKTFLPVNFRGRSYGSTGLVTTALDLAKWDRVFYEPVFGQGVKQLQLQPGKLNNGQLIPYAFGLEIEPYKGKTAITHSGADAGYKAEILRFPGEGFTIICLANSEDAYGLTNKLFAIAEIFLHFRQRAEVYQKSTCPPAPGAYIHAASRAAMKFVAVNREVRIGSSAGGYYELLQPMGDCYYSVKDNLLDSYHFKKDSLVFTTRAESAIYIPIKAISPFATDVQAAAGAWYSSELDATYHFYEKEGSLVLKLFGVYDIVLTAYENNLYAGEFLGTNVIEFVKNAKGEIEWMRFNREGVRDLLFKRE